MSRVYRFDEAVSRPQPTPADFAEELVFVRESLTEMCEEGMVSGAFIYGPVSAEPGPRSDIDIMISAPRTDLATAQSIGSMTKAVYERSGIPVDAVCYSEKDLVTGQHGYFHEHMLVWFGMLADKKPENIIGKNPLDTAQPVQGDLLANIDKKLGGFTHEFETTLMEGTYWHPELTLEKILNLPSRAGRHVLGSLMVRGRIPKDTLKSSQKSTVDAAVKQLFGSVDPTITAPYEQITDSSESYSHLLDETSAGSVSRSEYDGAIRQLIETNLPRAIILAGRLRLSFRVLADLPLFS